jgi:hypothetical protein
VITRGRFSVIHPNRLEAGGGGADDSDVTIDPITEAATRLLDAQGLENFSDAGIDAVIEAVQAANATTSFVAIDLETAVALATTTAANDAATQMALQENKCVGDCSLNQVVTPDELLVGVEIALGHAAVDACGAFDAGDDGVVTVDELLRAVNVAGGVCMP